MNIYAKLIKTKKKQTTYNYNQVTSNNVLDYTPKKIFNQSNDIIISLTTIPTRFTSKEFLLVLNSFYNQTLKPKYIYIHICKEYKREFTYRQDLIDARIDYIRFRYTNIIVNYTLDYGPITKVLGLLNVKCDDNDKIIIVDDDWIMHSMMTLYYQTCYELYNCDCIAVNERDLIDWTVGIDNLLEIKNIFNDNYQNMLYGWLSYSIRYKYIKQLYVFYSNIIINGDNIIYHDDLILTLFYKSINIYTCGINIFFNQRPSISLDSLDALRDTNKNSSYSFRSNLEMLYFNKYNYPYYYKKNHIYLDNNAPDNCVYKLNDYEEKTVITNIMNINNNDTNIHALFTYFNDNVFILTVSFTNTIIQNIQILINNIPVDITLNCNYWSYKQTFMFHVEDILNEIKYGPKNTIIQPINYNITRDIFYNVMTILNNMPYCNYIVFNDTITQSFIKHNYPHYILQAYNSIINSDYKDEIFIALYLYKKDGLYINPKCSLYINIDQYIVNNELFIYNTNQIMYSQHSSGFMKRMLIDALINIINKSYDNTTSLNYINSYAKFSLNCINNIIVDDKNIVCVNYNTYPSIDINFNPIDVPYNKINFVNHILWINLKRSTERSAQMTELLNNIMIPNTRIDAFDGREIDLHAKMPNLDNSHLSPAELATLFSHIKAISACQLLTGDYFLICEDDIALGNLFLFNNDLKDIIVNSPKFDILQIQKIVYCKHLDNIYSKLSDLVTSDSEFVSGTAAYIISRDGVKNFVNNVAGFVENKLQIINKKLNVADYYVYRYVETYVYKYNFISTLDKDSEIHPDHLPIHRTSSMFEIDRIMNDVMANI
jgi:GR25 family glycosyltransferase involved in LPS biosynthesis